jgi:site-specific recombinase XerD
LRIGEALALEASDIETAGNGIAIIHVPCEKGCKTGARDVPVALTDGSGNPTRLGRELNTWMAMKGDSDGCLFSTYAGTVLHPNSFNRSLKTYAAKAGVSKRVHAHAFRHTYATEKVRSGWAQAEVQAALGHESPSTTSIYVKSDISRLVELEDKSR